MQGHYQQQQQRREDAALWTSYLLTAQTGQEITPQQLLGTEDEVQAAKETEAEKKIAELQERMKKASLPDE